MKLILSAESPQQTTALTINQTFQKAIAHHQADQLQDAERLYRTILQAQPNHADANHNLGVLAVQVKQPAAGLSHLKAALEANPNQGQYWLSYINALIQADQTDAAKEVLLQGRECGLGGAAVEALAVRLSKEVTHAPLNVPGRNDCAGSLHIAPAGQTINQKILKPKPQKQVKSVRKSAHQQKKSPGSQEINTLVALFGEGRYAEVATLAQRMIRAYPLHGFGWKALGAAYKQMGQQAAALVAMEKAAVLLPNDAEAHTNLGVAYRDLGKLNKSEACYRRAFEINPDYVEAHYNLGSTLSDLGQFPEAESSYRRALQIKPDYFEVYINLGNLLTVQRRFAEAETSYRRALQIKPDYVEVLNNLALMLRDQGESIKSLDAIKQSLQLKETKEAKMIFVACVKNLRWKHDDAGIRMALGRALVEQWGQPSELVGICTDLIKNNPIVRECVTRADEAWPMSLSASNLLGVSGLATVEADTLLYNLLISAPICDIGMERFLTMARYAMLEVTTGMIAVDGGAMATALNFYSALARQCFINEYVFTYTDDEIQKASNLRELLVAALETKSHVPDLWLVTVAAYFPLCTLPFASQLLERTWPDAVAAVIVQQAREPEEELQLRTTISRITEIEGEVSLLVRNQYEENPYPRWVKAAPVLEAKSIFGYLYQKFPLASFNRQGKSGNVEILIAGCGTGQHSIGVAQQFQEAQVLAIDLSISSLSYAKRKTRELGLTSIEYAQADLMKLGALGRSFDVIESVGVLHHLADPWSGWKVLLSLLRPDGLMKLGFYSEVARRNIVRIRNFIAERGYGSSANEIRRCRQDLVDLNKSADFGNTITSSDFYNISTCRDLLFHVQEHRMTLNGIDAFLRENNLAFLGFETDPQVLHAYKLRFPEDSAATNLGQWQIFENENPDTFFGMYQFWIQQVG